MAIHNPAVIGEINTTPLIDVLLVLLVMLVITIPASTHTTDFDLPGEGPVSTLDPVMNRIGLTQGNEILWNSQPISQPQLLATLQASKRLPVAPVILFQPERNASYELSALVMATVERSGVSNFGFVGNEAFAEFGKPARLTGAR